MKIDQILGGDCIWRLREDFPPNIFDLILTSPPFADLRPGGIHPDHYLDWFLPRAAEIKRVLKPTGSFILNIKEHSVEGEKHPYVMDLVLAMRRHLGWRLPEQYIWNKSNAYPGKWDDRFRNAWESLFQFTKSKEVFMNQDEVMVPAVSEVRPSWKGEHNYYSKTGSGFSRKQNNWVGREKAYPTNVLYLAGETHNHDHNSPWPESIPDWFIRCFCPPDGLVLDPFAGSGTTCVAAKRLGRHYVGIDIEDRNVLISRARLEGIEPE
jgi:site-specific DNA-methyltransferase (adenine-specific)